MFLLISSYVPFILVCHREQSEETKKAVKAEVAEVVRNYNKMYNDMLTEQLNIQEQLKAKHADELAKASTRYELFSRI
jgi:hypothetical protein